VSADAGNAATLGSDGFIYVEDAATQLGGVEDVVGNDGTTVLFKVISA
jgi:hypothetical protein